MIAFDWVSIAQWVVIVLLAIVVVTAALSVSLHALLAVAQDSLPYLLALAWFTLVLAVIDRAWWRAAASAALVGYHLYLVVPRLRSDRIPHWASSATRLRLVVSNVYTENPTPQLLAAELLRADGDVMIITEWNERFAAALDLAGGTQSHPKCAARIEFLANRGGRVRRRWRISRIPLRLY